MLTPNILTCSHKNQLNSQSTSYEWLSSRIACSLPILAHVSSSVKIVHVELDHHSERNSISVSFATHI